VASNIVLLHASHAHMCMLLHLDIALVHTMCMTITWSKFFEE